MMTIHRHVLTPDTRSSGFITVDFMFAFVMVTGLCTILFSLTFALVASEIAQYMTFAAARSYYAAHVTIAAQNSLGLRKFQELQNTPVLGNFFKNGWVQITTPGGVLVQEFLDYHQQANDPADANLFWGARTQIRVKVLERDNPLLGSTNNANPLTATVGSYLGREVTTEECLTFTQERWERIKRLNPEYPRAASLPVEYALIADNGC